MSSTTKKVRIDPKSRRIVDELKTTDDLYRDAASYERQLLEDNKRKLGNLARKISTQGDELIQEVEHKHQAKEEERIAMIEQIYKLSGEQLITVKDAQNQPIEDLSPLLIKAKELGKPWYNKLLDFLMGWEDVNKD